MISSFANTAFISQLGVMVNRLEMINEETIDQLLGSCIRFRIDTIFVPIVSYMEALYESMILPKSNVLINNQSAAGFDPLRYLMEKGKRFGIVVIPVVDFFTVWPSIDFPFNKLHISNKNLNWLSLDSMGRLLPDPVILDPGVPEVQVFLISLLKEILTRYTLPFLAFENFQYPNSSYGYNPYALKEYEKWKRDAFKTIATMDEFRVQTLTTILRRMNALRDSVGVGTRFLIIAQTDPVRSKREFFQDWLVWLNSKLFETAALWYWFPDVKTVRYDTLVMFESLSEKSFLVGIKPASLIPAQLDLVLAELTTYPIRGVVVDTFDPGILSVLNAYGIGIPR